MSDRARWQELDRRHHLHPFSDQAELGRKGSRVITAAEGCWLVDSEGERLIDGMAGLWCVNVGYGRSELVAAATEQMQRLPYYNTFFQTTTPAAAELSAKLAEITPPGLDRLFFANSGSEANDSAIKLIRYFWNLQGKPEKKIIISRDYGYHGVTLAAASLSGLKAMHPQADLPLPGFSHIDAPYHFAHGGDLEPAVFAAQAADALEKRIIELGADKVAAFVGEPVQGAGGVIIPHDSYWRKVQEICRRHDVLLIADEVICGFGRTGNWWGSTTFGIEPDMITMAKGLSSGYQPISAVAVGERIGEALVNSGEEWSHGFTYSGHPVAAAVALANLRVIEEEGLQTRASGPVGVHFAKMLDDLAGHPLIGEARACGLLGALEIVPDKAGHDVSPDQDIGRRCRDHALEAGLVMRAVRDVMVLSPPLIITEEEIDEIGSRARRALDQTAKDLGLA